MSITWGDIRRKENTVRMLTIETPRPLLLGIQRGLVETTGTGQYLQTWDKRELDIISEIDGHLAAMQRHMSRGEIREATIHGEAARGLIRKWHEGNRVEDNDHRRLPAISAPLSRKLTDLMEKQEPLQAAI